MQKRTPDVPLTPATRRPTARGRRDFQVARRMRAGICCGRGCLAVTVVDRGGSDQSAGAASEIRPAAATGVYPVCPSSLDAPAALCSFSLVPASSARAVRTNHHSTITLAAVAGRPKHTRHTGPVTESAYLQPIVVLRANHRISRFPPTREKRAVSMSAKEYTAIPARHLARAPTHIMKVSYDTTEGYIIWANVFQKLRELSEIYLKTAHQR